MKTNLVYSERLRKNTKNLGQDFPLPGWESNTEPPAYEAVVPSIKSQRLVQQATLGEGSVSWGMKTIEPGSISLELPGVMPLVHLQGSSLGAGMDLPFHLSLFRLIVRLTSLCDALCTKTGNWTCMCIDGTASPVEIHTQAGQRSEGRKIARVSGVELHGTKQRCDVSFCLSVHLYFLFPAPLISLPPPFILLFAVPLFYFPSCFRLSFSHLLSSPFSPAPLRGT